MKYTLIITLLILSVFTFNLKHFFTYKELRVVEVGVNHLDVNGGVEGGIEDIIRLSLDKTTDKLSFSPFSKNNLNVDYLDKSGKAHCWGYAAYNNAVITKLLKNNNNKDYIVYQSRAKVYLFGFDLHQFFTNKGLVDHDISVILNKKTGSKIYVDPSLSEVFGTILSYTTGK